jgi:MoaA/NifB/PqqE/SkfB family radical SAM enzyme
MELNGLHLLLSYQCTYECDHCFVWSSPWQRGTMTLADVDHILREAQTVDTVRSIYFEGGEPFLFFTTLVYGVRSAAAMGFEVGIVSNAYWATSERDAREWLRPLAGLVDDLSLSEDAYHGTEEDLARVANARAAAEAWGIPVGAIAVAQPEQEAGGEATTGQLPQGTSAVMYRGRAAEKLAARAPQVAREQLTCCPYEDLREPGRVHVDPLGYVHVCQGITIGNMLQRPLREIVAAYDADAHPITGPLLEGGPLALAQRYGVAQRTAYADACHMCYETRQALRTRFAQVLGPEQMYGVG